MAPWIAPPLDFEFQMLFNFLIPFGTQAIMTSIILLKKLL
jgi:hypothetical protein